MTNEDEVAAQQGGPALTQRLVSSQEERDMETTWRDSRD